MAQAAAAYAAKVTASALFVSGRTLDSVMQQEFAPVRPLDAMIRALLQVEVDYEGRAVTCRLGAGRATAVFHHGLGCSLVHGAVDPARRRYARPLAPFELDRAPIDAPWPRGDGPATSSPHIDVTALGAAVDGAFEETDRRRPIFTRAVVVAHQGALVAERYASGIGPQTPLPGWSMTKTLTNALIGVHVGRNAVDVGARPAVSGWREEGDLRARIRVDHLLSMRAGLRWSEDYSDASSDALQMLLGSRDHAAAYARQPAAAAPGARYQYASGATNLLCRELRVAYPTKRAYWQMPERFFQRVGMHTAVLETDPSGTFVGSSYGFASARDWARLGLLYLRDGVMFGERVLPEGWVRRSTAVTASPPSAGKFGWHVWLNHDPDGDGPLARPWPDLPEDVFHMDGHEGQYVVVVPSDDLVIVRLGCTKDGGFSIAKLVREVLAACR